MNPYKKLTLGLGLLFSVVLMGLITIKVLALTFNSGQVNISSIKIVDPGTITVSVKGQTITFKSGTDSLDQVKQAMGNPTNIAGIPYFYSGGGNPPLCKPAWPGTGNNGNPQNFQYQQILVQYNGPKLIQQNILTAVSMSLKLFSGDVDFTSCTFIPGLSASNITYNPATPPTGTGSQFTDPAFKGAKFAYQDGSTIVATLPNTNPAGGTTKIKFTDGDPVDSTHTSTSEGGKMCTPPGGTDTGTIKYNNGLQSSTTITPTTIVLNYFDTTKGNNACKPITLKNFSIDNGGLIAEQVLIWQTAQIDSIVQGGEKFDAKTLTGSNVSNNEFVENQQGCSGLAILLSSDNKGKLYSLGTGKNTVFKDIPSCQATLVGNVQILGKRGQANTGTCQPGNTTPDPTSGKCPDGSCPSGTTLDAATDTCTGGANNTAQDNNCEKDNNTGLEWLFCGILRSIDKVVTAMNNVIEGQLEFNTDDNLTPAVKKAWDTIKVLATIVLVIIMLVMVLSQATSSGSGPFDAYTVRKVLPKLVIAVIAVQLSWDLFIWVINITNDLGQAIANIMYGPFGGAKAMGLDAQISRMGAVVGNATTVTILTGLTAGILAAVINPFGAILLGFGVLMAVFVGLAVLLFRKVLIILCMIFVPIALVAWILPGTQKYWKLWWETFSKLLMMFPLIIGLIAAGRIFAFVSGSSARTPGLLDILAVLLGFFGPYFLLPKTFQWGGKALSTMANGINNNGAVKGFSEKSKAGIKGRQERWQGSSGKKYDPNANKFSRGYRRLQSGSFLPNERSRRLAIAKGDKWASERNDEATALAGRTYEKALAGYKTYDVDSDGNYVNYDRNAQGELLDSNGQVTKDEALAKILYRGKDKAQAKSRTITGVEAGKRALVDMVGQGHEGASDPEKRLAQAATKQLIDTHSEIEMQGARIVGGPNQGKRVSETAVYADTLTNSPQHYSAALRTRPDMAPDVIQTAEGRVSRAAGKRVTYETSDTAQRAELDKQRLAVTVERMTAENLQSSHYGLFNDIEKYGDQEVEITDVNGNKSKKKLSEHFADRLMHISRSPGPAGASAVGSLSGGKEVHVNGALEAAGIKLSDIK